MNDFRDQPEEFWRERLSEEQYKVLRKGGTEAPFSGEYVDLKQSGMFHCAACDAALFSSSAKFDSGTGWPSFFEPAVAEVLELRDDDSHLSAQAGGTRRTEVLCRRCGGHLGHVFDDGPAERGGKRYCINSTALDFREDSSVS